MKDLQNSNLNNEGVSPGNDFNPLDPENFTSAHEQYKELRQKCPVAHSNEWNGFWALLKYEDVNKALRNPKTFITSVQNVVPKVAFTGRRPPLHLDPPEHTPYRQALNPFFSKSKIHSFEPVVRQIIVDLLKSLLEKGGGDICKEFTQKLPAYTLSEFFNLSPELALSIREVTVTYNQAVQGANDEKVKEASLQLYQIARKIIQMRKTEPMDPAQDMTSALLAATHNDQPLPDEMVLGTIRQLIVVGMIAPSVFIGSMVAHLAQHQALQDQLRRDKRLISAAVEEYLRLFTPYRGFSRTATHDVVFGGRLIKKGEAIALVYSSANRDEAVFPDPDQFILNRPNIKQHIAFGLGPHNCIGAPLARLMLRVALEELLTRTSRIQLEGEIKMTRWPEWGTLSVPVKLEQA